jgi:hypothetical protein
MLSYVLLAPLQVFIWKARFKQSAEKIKMLNCYAPYKDRELFWQPIIDSGLLREEGIIVGGDLNFTLSAREVWGDLARSDPLADYFSSLILSSGLVDIQPTKMAPTWRNGRAGTTGISKRLDHFFLKNPFLAVIERSDLGSLILPFRIII